MVNITLEVIRNNGQVITDTYKIPQQTKECARKIIDYLSKSYYISSSIDYNDVVNHEQPTNIITNIPLAISKISDKLEQESSNKTITLTYTDDDNFIHNVRGNVNNIRTWERSTNRPGQRGGNKKEYIKLQYGGKRLVRYGKRGGRYYMKGGNKHYIK